MEVVTFQIKSSEACLALIIQILLLKQIFLKDSRALILATSNSSRQSYSKIDFYFTMLFSV